jgi:non-heme chloroperoxidase
MKFIESKTPGADPVKISYEDYGQGKPVVLIHGWPLSKEMWEYQLEPLVNAGFRVIKYDRRGFGKSGKPWDGYDYDSMTADLKSLLDELDVQDATLVGFSMGAGEVARYFTKYGNERVRRAVIISGVTPFMSQADDNPGGVPQEVFADMLQKMTDDRIGFLDDFGKQFFSIGLLSHPVSAPLLEYYRMLGSLASGRSTRECAKAFASTDFRSDLPNINVPTLLIHGTDDKTVPIEVSGDKTATLLPQSQYLRYDGAPHGLFYTHRERLNADLIEFIATGAVAEDRQDTVLLPSNEALITR